MFVDLRIVGCAVLVVAHAQLDASTCITFGIRHAEQALLEGAPEDRAGCGVGRLVEHLERDLILVAQAGVDHRLGVGLGVAGPRVESIVATRSGVI